jgi:hypothetical protein
VVIFQVGTRRSRAHVCTTSISKESNMPMQTIIKAALMAGAVAALACPLLFWGKSELLARNGHHTEQNNMRQTTFVLTPQYDPVW